MEGCGDFATPEGAEATLGPLFGEDEIEAKEDHRKIATEKEDGVENREPLFLNKES